MKKTRLSKKEADWYPVLRRFVRAKWPKGKSAAIEVKSVNGLSINFSAVKDHQIKALKSAKNGVFYQKISDIGIINYRPFDAFVLSGVSAYIVICFDPIKTCYGLEIDIFLSEKTNKKSLSANRLKEINNFSFCIK